MPRWPGGSRKFKKILGDPSVPGQASYAWRLVFVGARRKPMLAAAARVDLKVDASAGDFASCPFDAPGEHLQQA
jgi:hypothetical protein